jgi:outer membrane protein assembly factor BamB
MTLFRPSRPDNHLSNYWNALARNAPAEELARLAGLVEPSEIAAIEQAYAAHQRHQPDPVFARRLEQTLMNIATTISPVADTIPQQHISPPSRNGFRDPGPISRRRSTVTRPPFGLARRPAVAIALAILLVLTSLAGIWMMNTGQDEPHRLMAPVVSTPSPDTSPDVPMYRANPERTGVMPGPGIDGDPVELWRIEIQGKIENAAVVVDTVVYISATNGVLYALDAVSGETMWEYESLAPAPVTVVVAAGVVYGGSGSAALFALNAGDGSELWTAPDIQPSGALMIVEDVLYAGAADGNLYALNLDGNVLWRASLGDAPLRSPALSGELVYAGNETGALRAFDRTTGEPVWSFQTEGGGFAPTPMIYNGVIYQTTAEGAENYIYALDAISGEQRWRYDEPGNPGWFAGGTDGKMLFIPSANGALYALDTTTGEVVWQEQYGDFANAAPAIVNDLVYFAGRDGFVRALETSTGEDRWRFPIDGPASFGPVVADGVVYVGTDFGVMHAITGGGTAATPTADATSRAAATPAATPIASSATPSAATSIAEFVWQVGQEDGLSGQPIDVTIAPDGRIWVMGEGQFNLLDPEGSMIDTWAGPDPYVGALHFDRDGNLYIVDARNHRVLKFGPDREFLLAWGSQGEEDDQFQHASDLVVDSIGNVYILDEALKRIQKFGPDGTFLATISGRGDGEGQLSIPARMGIDQEDNIYVPDGSQVEVFAPDGTFLRSIVLGDTGIAIDAAVDANGNIFVSDVVKNQIQAYDPAGNLLGSWGTFGREPGNFIEVDAVTVDDLGNLYVVDFGNQRIQKFEVNLPAIPGATPAS